jgi:hypothetical protein
LRLFDGWPGIIRSMDAAPSDEGHMTVIGLGLPLSNGAIAMRRPTLPCIILALSIMPPSASAAEVPGAIAAPGEILVATINAIGAQVYECKSDAAGKLTWQFREPIATLFIDGKTVGRHYAGPSWEMTDGSVVSGKVASRASGATPNDIPLLKLDVTSRRGQGELANVTTIQRINTRGGVVDGMCESRGAFLSVPYTADYAFYRKRD